MLERIKDWLVRKNTLHKGAKGAYSLLILGENVAISIDERLLFTTKIDKKMITRVKRSKKVKILADGTTFRGQLKSFAEQSDTLTMSKGEYLCIYAKKDMYGLMLDHTLFLLVKAGTKDPAYTKDLWYLKHVNPVALQGVGKNRKTNSVGKL